MINQFVALGTPPPLAPPKAPYQPPLPPSSMGPPAKSWFSEGDSRGAGPRAGT